MITLTGAGLLPSADPTQPLDIGLGIPQGFDNPIQRDFIPPPEDNADEQSLADLRAKGMQEDARIWQKRRAESWKRLDDALLNQEDFFKKNPYTPFPGQDPQKEQKEILTKWYMLERLGVDKIPGGRMGEEIARRRIARSLFNGKGENSIDDFHAAITEDAKQRKDQRDASAFVADQAVDSAMLDHAGQDNPRSWSVVRDELSKKPGYQKHRDVEYMATWTAAREKTRDIIEPYADELSQVWSAMKAGNAGTASTVGKKVLGALLPDGTSSTPIKDIVDEAKREDAGAVAFRIYKNLSPEQRDGFKNALGLFARTLPKEEQATFLGNLAKQGGRDVDSLVRSAGEAFIANSMSSLGAMPLTVSSPTRLVPGDTRPTNYQGMTQSQADAARANYMAAKNFATDVRNIAQGIHDPVKSAWGNGEPGMWEKGLYGVPGVVASSVEAMLPGVGWSAMYLTMQGQAYDDIREQIKKAGGSEEQASRIADNLAPWIAIPQTALEKVQANALVGKLPGMNRFMNFVGDRIKSKVARFGIAAGAATVEETGIEMLQNMGPPLAQDIAHWMGEGVKATDWYNGKDGALDGFWMQAGQVAVSMFPLAFLEGAHHLNTETRARALAEVDRLTRTAFGIRAEDNDAIDAAALKGQSSLNEAAEKALANRDPNSDEAKEAVRIKNAEEEQKRLEYEEMRRRNLIPEVRVEDDGSLTVRQGATGEVIGTASNPQDAMAIAAQHSAAVEQAGKDWVAYMTENIDAAMEGKRMDPTSEGRVQLGTHMTEAMLAVEDPESAARFAREVALKEKASGGDGSMAYAILGSSKTEVAGNIRRTINRFFQGASALTVFHETFHGLRQKALAAGLITRDDEIQLLRALDQILAGKVVRKDGTQLRFIPEGMTDQEITDTHLDEAMSEIAEMEILRTRQGGTKRTQDGRATVMGERTSGIVTRSLSAIARLAPGAAKKFAAFFHAVRSHWGLSMSRALALKKAEREGSFNPQQLQEHLSKMLGVTQQEQHDQQARQETKDIIGDQADAEMTEQEAIASETSMAISGSKISLVTDWTGIEMNAIEGLERLAQMEVRYRTWSDAKYDEVMGPPREEWAKLHPELQKLIESKPTTDSEEKAKKKAKDKRNKWIEENRPEAIENRPVRNVHGIQEYLDANPQELAEMRDVQQLLEGRINLVDEKGQVAKIAIEQAMSTRPGRENLPRFQRFTRSIPQIYLDQLDQHTYISIHRKINDAMEKAFKARNKGEYNKTIPGFTKRNAKTAGTGASGIEGEAEEFNVQTPLRFAEKTLAALNLNSACPMFTVGNRGCWGDACYLTQMAAGATGTNLFARAMYAGEILQWSQKEIDWINSNGNEGGSGGLRVNGVGDTTPDNVEQMKTIIRHAGMRGLKLKVITKQEVTLKALQEIANEGGKINHVQVQISIDYYWRPVEMDLEDDRSGARFLAGNSHEAVARLLAEKDEEKAQDMLDEIYSRFGREIRLIDGVWHRKDGFSWWQAHQLMSKYDKVQIMPRVIVGSVAEILDAVENHPGAILTLMHGKLGEGLRSDFNDQQYNYGASRHGYTWDGQKKEIRVWADASSPSIVKGVLQRKEVVQKEGHKALEEAINTRYTPQQRRKIYEVLRDSTCCQQSDKPDACAACQSYCNNRQLLDPKKMGKAIPWRNFSNRAGVQLQQDQNVSVPIPEQATTSLSLSRSDLSMEASVTRHPSEKTDTPLGDTYKVDVDGFLYRAVTQSDFDRIENQGFIDSDRRHSDKNEGINLAANPMSSISYEQKGENMVLMKIDPKGLSLNGWTHDHYIRTWDRIPYENIVSAEKFIGGETLPSSLQQTTSMSVTPEQDTRYLELAQDPESNKVELQSMVDQAASEAGYTIRAYHGTVRNFNEFKPPGYFGSAKPRTTGSKYLGNRGIHWFSTNLETAEGYGRNYRSDAKPKRVIDAYLKIENPMAIDAKGESWSTVMRDVANAYDSGKHDGVVISNIEDEFNVERDAPVKLTTTVAVFNPNQVKVADAVTYDDNGNVIPLSERFNPTSNDIRFSIAPAAQVDALSLNATRRIKDPQLKAAMFGRIVERLAKLRALIDARGVAYNFDAFGKPYNKPISAEKNDILNGLAMLDGILGALPLELRGKIGGYTQLAKFNTDEERLDYLKRTMKRVDEHVERYLVKEYGRLFDNLLERERVKKNKAGKAPKGKAGADVHSLFATLRQAMSWSPEAATAHSDGLFAEIATGTLSPEDEAHKLLEANLVTLVADWNNADSARRASALENATNVYLNGYYRTKLQKLLKKEDRQIRREEFIATTGKQGTAPEIYQREAEENKVGSKWKNALKSLLSFEQIMTGAFGETEEVRRLVDMEREASQKKDDGIYGATDALEDFFAGLAGGRLAGEQLRWKMSQKSMTIEGHPLSELQALTATMMWRQPDGRRHMEGTKDENGKPNGTWHYTQGFIDQIELALSPEAKAVRNFLSQRYAAEYDRLNPIYQKLNGISLPHNPMYSPLTVSPLQAQGGDLHDPFTGMQVNGTSTTPPSLRTRGTSISRPRFEDALQVYIAHVKQMEHWMAYAELAEEMRALLANRNVRDAVQAAAGLEHVSVLGTWIDHFAQGGTRDAAGHLALNKALNRAMGRAAAIGMVGRLGVLAIQSVQLGAALAEMPTASYLKRLGMLMTGQMGWGKALKSDFIQRRMREMPPVVRQAIEGLASAKPNMTKYWVQKLGSLIGGTDALFTAGTYAMVYDYQLKIAKKEFGLTGTDAEDFARNAAERAVERVAQPTRSGTRSIYEVTAKNPLVKLSWAFASEARQKLALSCYALTHKDVSWDRKARAVAVTWLVGGMLTTLIRTVWRDMKDHDDEEWFDDKNWGVKKLVLSSVLGPLSGMPVLGDIIEGGVYKAAGEYLPEGNLLSATTRAAGAAKHAKEWFSGEREIDDTLKDWDTILSGLGVANETIAASASLSHLALDLFQLTKNATD